MNENIARENNMNECFRMDLNGDMNMERQDIGTQELRLCQTIYLATKYFKSSLLRKM